MRKRACPDLDTTLTVRAAGGAQLDVSLAQWYCRCSTVRNCVDLTRGASALPLPNVHNEDLALVDQLVCAHIGSARGVCAALEQRSAAEWLRLLDALESLDFLKATRQELLQHITCPSLGGQQLLDLWDRLTPDGAALPGMEARFAELLKGVGDVATLPAAALCRLVEVAGVLQDDVAFFRKVALSKRLTAWQHSRLTTTSALRLTLAMLEMELGFFEVAATLFGGHAPATLQAVFAMDDCLTLLRYLSITRPDPASIVALSNAVYHCSTPAPAGAAAPHSLPERLRFLALSDSFEVMAGAVHYIRNVRVEVKASSYDAGHSKADRVMGGYVPAATVEFSRPCRCLYYDPERKIEDPSRNLWVRCHQRVYILFD